MQNSWAGTIYQRGEIWWVKIHVDGKAVYRSSKSRSRQDAVKLRNQLLGKKERGEIGTGPSALIDELLDDVLKSDIADSTRYIWRRVVQKNIRPFFGKLRAASLTTDRMDQYRDRRRKSGASDATVNRELTILRTAFNNARKRTPPKVFNVPYFPMTAESNVRQGFLADEKYEQLRDALPEELRPLSVTAYFVGGRKSELLALNWDWIDFEKGLISIPAHVSKTREGRLIPIVSGDMQNLLLASKNEPDANWPGSPCLHERCVRLCWLHSCRHAPRRF